MRARGRWSVGSDEPDQPALDANLVAFIVGANTVFGLLFGYLFWRYGLESAMVAHALAHAVGYVANLA